MIELKQISLENKNILREMLRDYEQELTGQENPGEYKYLDSYWEKATRHPFFIILDEEIAGFALVNQHTLVQSEGHNLAEFYIKKQFRAKGVGKEAAFKLFDLFPGKWETRELADNKNAHAFWLKVINEYTKGNYKEIVMANENWQGPVQVFDNQFLDKG